MKPILSIPSDRSASAYALLSRDCPKSRGFIIYNAVSFQFVWWSSVLWLNFSLILTIPLLLLHFILLIGQGKRQCYKLDWMLILKLAPIGMAIDTLLVIFGVFEFAVFPWWLICLWLHFILSLHYSLAFMRHWPLFLQVIIGGIFGCLSYVAGAKMSAVTFPLELISTCIVLAMIWCLLFPLLLHLTHSNSLMAFKTLLLSCQRVFNRGTDRRL